MSQSDQNDWIDEPEDERLSLIEQERIVESLIRSPKLCHKQFTPVVEKAYLKQSFKENYVGFKVSVVSLVSLTLLLVIGTALFTWLGFNGAIKFTHQGIVLLCAFCAIFYYIAKSESFSSRSQIHLQLLLITNAVVYSTYAMEFNSTIVLNLVVFLMMVGQSILLLLNTVSRVSCAIIGTLSFLIFNFSIVVADKVNYLNSPELWIMSNIIIIGMIFMVSMVNGIQETTRRKHFLFAYHKILKESMDKKTNSELESLEAINHSTIKNKKKLVSVDPDTSISNAKSFLRYLKEEWVCAYGARQSLALIIVDLGLAPFSRLEEVEAKNLVRSACEEMKRFARRSGDLVGRFEEDRYAILLENTDLENARKLAERLLQLLQQLFAPYRSQCSEAEQESVKFGINIGVASALPMPGIGADDLIIRAEEALNGALNRDINKPGSNTK